MGFELYRDGPVSLSSRPDEVNSANLLLLLPEPARHVGHELSNRKTVKEVWHCRKGFRNGKRISSEENRPEIAAGRRPLPLPWSRALILITCTEMTVSHVNTFFEKATIKKSVANTRNLLFTESKNCCKRAF